MANEKRIRADYVFGTTDTSLDTGSTSATLLADNFDRADATALGAPQTGSAPVYYSAELQTATPQWGIAGNAAKPNGSASTAQYAMWDVGSTTYVLTATLAQLATGASGNPAISSLVVRASPANFGEHYLVQASGAGFWELYYRPTEVQYTKVQTSSIVAATGDVLEVTVTSTAIAVKVNGVAALSTTNAQFNTNTRVGLRAYDGNVKWDNVTVTTIPSGVATSALSSPALSRLPAIDSTGHAAITLTDPATGVYEIVHAIVHAANAATATVQRGREGSTARSWPSGTTWQHGPTAADFPLVGDGQLAYVSYGPAGFTARSTNSTSFADVDATNLVASFVGPQSGFVWVMMSARVTVGGSAYSWGLRSGTSLVAGSESIVSGTSLTQVRVTHRRRLAVTPGQSYTWKWAHRLIAGATTASLDYWASEGQEAILAIEDASTVGPKGDKGDPGGATLDDLTDVDVTGALEGQVLQVDAGGVWRPVAAGGGGIYRGIYGGPEPVFGPETFSQLAELDSYVLTDNASGVEIKEIVTGLTGVPSGTTTGMRVRGGNTGNSWIERVITLDRNGTLSFNEHAETENTAFDNARFYIDGAVQYARGNNTNVWMSRSYVLSAGTHTLRWSIERDNSGVAGYDGFTITDVLLTQVQQVLAGDFVRHDGDLWQAKVDGPVGAPAESSQWTRLVDSYDDTDLLTRVDTVEDLFAGLGGTIHAGTGAPPAGTGVAGDYWHDTVGKKLYGPKGTDAAWGATVQPVFRAQTQRSGGGALAVPTGTQVGDQLLLASSGFFALPGTATGFTSLQSAAAGNYSQRVMVKTATPSDLTDGITTLGDQNSDHILLAYGSATGARASGIATFASAVNPVGPAVTNPGGLSAVVWALTASSLLGLPTSAGSYQNRATRLGSSGLRLYDLALTTTTVPQPTHNTDGNQSVLTAVVLEPAVAVTTMDLAGYDDAELQTVVADHETRIDTLESAPGGGSVAVASSGVRVERATDLVVAAATHIRVPWETAPVEQGEWWAATSPEWLTIPATGWYIVSAHVRYVSDPGSVAYHRLAVGSTSDAAGAGTTIATTQTSASGDVDDSLAGVFYATAGQVVWLNLWEGIQSTVDAARMMLTPVGGPKGDKGDPGHIGDSSPGANAWYAETNTQVTAAANVDTTVHEHTIVGAKAGTYVIHGTAQLNGTISAGGLAIVVGATTVSRIPTHGASQPVRSLAGVYVHPADGDLTVLLRHQAETASQQYGIAGDSRFGRKTTVMRLTNQGPAGPAGPAAAGFLSGAGAPTGATGATGDHYADTTTGTIYGPKGAVTSDDFNRANGAPGSTSVGAKPWIGSANNTYAIIDNQLGTTATLDGQTLMTDCGMSDGVLTVTYATLEDWAGIKIAADASGVGLVWMPNRAILNLGATDLATGSNTNLSAGTVITITKTGQNLVIKNGSTTVLTHTLAAPATGTHWGFKGGTGGIMRWDNFAVAPAATWPVAVAASSSTGGVTETFTSEAVVVKTGTGRLYNDSGRTLTISRIRASLGTAGTTATTVDVNKGGTTLYTTQANRPSLASGVVTATALPDVTTWEDGSYLTVDIDAAGTGAAVLTVTITAS